MKRVVQFVIAPLAGPLMLPADGVPFVHDHRHVGVVESLLPEARGSRPEAEGRSLLGVAKLDDSPAADRAWRAIRKGGVTGIRLDIGDLRTPEGELVRGRALHRVRVVALDDAPDPGRACSRHGRRARLPAQMGHRGGHCLVTTGT
jgi:hypothetical protein